MDKNLHELCYMLDEQIERAVKKGDINPNEMHSIYEAVKTKYYITVMKAMERAEDDYGYSGRRMMVSYDGHPYASYDDGYSTRGRDSMGRYTSRDGDDMRMHLEAAMNAAKTEQERQTIRNMMNNM
jgi:hypothetical protein